MNDILVGVLLLILGAVAGAFFGNAADKHYFKTHCDATGKVLIDAQVYECRAAPKEPK